MAELNADSLRKALEWGSEWVDKAPTRQDPLLLVSPTQYKRFKEAGYITENDDINWGKVSEDFYKLFYESRIDGGIG